MSNSNTTQHHPHFNPEPVEISQYTYDATTEPTTTVIHDHVEHDAAKKHPATTASSLPASRIHLVEENTHHLHPAVEQPEVHDKKHTTVVKQHPEPEFEHHPEPHHAPKTEHPTSHQPKPTPHHDPQPATHQSIEPHTETHDHPKEQHASPRTAHPESHHGKPTPHEPTHQHPQDHAPHHTPTSPSSTISSDSVQTPQSPSEIFGSPDRRQSWSKDEAKRGVMRGLLDQGKKKQEKGGYSSTDVEAGVSLTL
jgi:hypothetical protein